MKSDVGGIFQLGFAYPFFKRRNEPQREEDKNMKHRKRIYLAAGLLFGAAALTGCAAQTTPVVTPTPDTAKTMTAQPATAQPETTATPEESAPAGEETPGPIVLRVNGEELKTRALEENGKLLLPLVETAEVLGWSAEEDSVKEETQTRRSIVLTQGESRISVTWVVNDNTARQITWQKDGLLIPVDPKITTLDEAVYVPAAFFEEAMDVTVRRETDGVAVATPQPKETPETSEQEAANG